MYYLTDKTDSFLNKKLPNTSKKFLVLENLCTSFSSAFLIRGPNGTGKSTFLSKKNNLRRLTLKTINCFLFNSYKLKNTLNIDKIINLGYRSEEYLFELSLGNINFLNFLVNILYFKK